MGIRGALNNYFRFQRIKFLNSGSKKLITSINLHNLRMFKDKALILRGRDKIRPMERLKSIVRTKFLKNLVI